MSRVLFASIGPTLLPLPLTPPQPLVLLSSTTLSPPLPPLPPAMLPPFPPPLLSPLPLLLPCPLTLPPPLPPLLTLLPPLPLLPLLPHVPPTLWLFTQPAGIEVRLPACSTAPLPLAEKARDHSASQPPSGAAPASPGKLLLLRLSLVLLLLL